MWSQLATAIVGVNGAPNLAPGSRVSSGPTRDRRRTRYDQFSYGVHYDWARLRPYAEKIRAETGMPAILEHFEWLAKEMAGIDRRKGQEIVFDAAYLAARLPASLDRCTSQLRFFERSRAVYLGEAPVAETVTGPVTEKAPAPVA